MISSACGLTVFGPEVAKAGLTTALHHFIEARSGLRIEDCFLVLHTRRSIRAFYQLTGSTGGDHWDLVESLFDLRPACVTLWSGEDALKRLQRLKGATQPAEAEPGTVRSLFWCDNPVANLIHVSDTPEVMASELQILRSKAIGGDLRAWQGAAGHRYSHSALWTLNALLARHLGRSERYSDLPADGNARLSANLLWHQAEDLAMNAGLEDPVRRYLLGESDALTELLQGAGQVSAWERLMLRCGRHSNPVWASRIAMSAVEDSLAQCR
ncbi:nucleoside-diphosphate kinase [Pontivivens ytuae]|uniref:Nucleoside-diphosphate kinase n=1 Tax=Pontivivens ytuae TaxID=2789856 RepID=A0A7S9LT31_9RHOB|nr:nucleoside-diphosphate kinase [Pontivivens ytuae]QPH54789.1 nucleoside-diphosphate kinase [Pontivivens ytuae]